MFRITSSILLVALLINFTCGLERWVKSAGVANLDCPLDDNPDEPTLLAFSGDCSKFIKCSYGLGYTLSCPRGLHFSTALLRCEAPTIAKCNSNGTPSNPQVGGGTCTFMYKSHPTDCSKAIQCVNGVEIELDCPAGSKWDKSNSKCSFGNVVC
ncbi:peritrophin-1-like [Eupeodes corollae]|uniref:peritrophin-1-like n=1 Tax=Eupeodes corollae TaxID=290404 RepID=UPI0024912F61|nr:peritrophin-1-like [Eupeodes corollae]